MACGRPEQVSGYFPASVVPKDSSQSSSRGRIRDILSSRWEESSIRKQVRIGAQLPPRLHLPPRSLCEFFVIKFDKFVHLGYRKRLRPLLLQQARHGIGLRKRRSLWQCWGRSWSRLAQSQWSFSISGMSRRSPRRLHKFHRSSTLEVHSGLVRQLWYWVTRIYLRTNWFSKLDAINNALKRLPTRQLRRG